MSWRTEILNTLDLTSYREAREHCEQRTVTSSSNSSTLSISASKSTPASQNFVLKNLKQGKIMEGCLAVDQNKEVEYIFPEYWPTEPFFSVHYPCRCGKEVVVVPMTLSRYMARGLQDLGDPNEQHRNYALSLRSNHDHVYPEPRNNFLIDCGNYANRESDENENYGNRNIRDDGNANVRHDGNQNIRDDGGENRYRGVENAENHQQDEYSQENPPQQPQGHLPEPRRSIPSMEHSDDEFDESSQESEDGPDSEPER